VSYLAAVTPIATRQGAENLGKSSRSEGRGRCYCRRSIGQSANGEVEAVADLSFSVPAGTIFGLLGRNGAGKTTTLECCIGIGKPTSGAIRVLDLDPTRPRDLNRAAPAHRRAASGNILAGKSERARSARVICRLLQHPAARWRDGRTGRSRGETRAPDGANVRWRAAALSPRTRAAARSRRVVSLDEPTAGMDTFGRRISGLRSNGCAPPARRSSSRPTISKKPSALSDRICMVQRGKIVAEAPPADLVAQYGGEATVSIVADGFVPDRALEALERGRRPVMSGNSHP